MTTFTGTSGNDVLTGGDSADLFQPLLGIDVVHGEAGIDTLSLDWSSIAANGGTGAISAAGGSFSGSLSAGSGQAELTFDGIEAVVAVLSTGSDTLTVDAAPLAAGASLSVSGGGGFDTLQADFSAFASTSFAMGVNFLISTNHGNWAGFEQFDLTLGAGTNGVTLQGGNDTVRSNGGVDTIDLGGGRDSWIADFSSWSANISFGWDGDRNLAAVSNGSYVSHVEGGAITGGSGDDAFFLNGANGFAVDGGAGRDVLVWDESGLLTVPYSAAFIAGVGGSYDGWVRSSTFAGIEQVNVALSDGDNTAYVDVAPLAQGATMNLDGGGGSDTLEVDFSVFADTTFAIDASGTALTSHGTYGNFENFSMALGGGHNVVATGAGDDMVYSLGGVDQIDAGSGFDFWGGDYSGNAGAIAFNWDGASGSASLSNGTSLTGFEAGYLVGTAGADTFSLSGALPFDVYGGAGSDTLVRSDAGVTGGNTDSFIYAAPGWFWGFAGNGQFDEIEHLSVTFGDGDDTVFVDAAALAAGATIALNGGVGSDTLLLDLSALAGSVFTVSADGAVSGNRGSFAGFEAYSIGLGGGANTVTLGAGNDMVQASFGGASTISLGAGDDEAWGGTGTETVYGGAGTDRFHVLGLMADFAVSQDGTGGYLVTDHNLADGDQGSDHLSGVEWLVFDDGALALPDYAGGVTLTGTAGADTLTGGVGADRLSGLAGNDLLSGGAGNDTLDGGAGNDWLSGEAGNDAITGGDGIDTLTYDDAVAGVMVDLSLVGTAQATGGSGSDVLGDALENLTGSAFGDTLTGNALANVITGLAGDDVIDGGAGADTLIGGLGSDSYVVDDAGDGVTELAGEGTDSVTARLSWTLGANLENLTLAAGTQAWDGTGNGLGNGLVGNDGANRLYGLDGNDTLGGGGGNDWLSGGAGSDTITGGAGLDTLAYDDAAGAVRVDLSLVGTAQATGGSGSDVLGDALENLTGSAFGDALTGNALANVITGLAGDDVIDGGAGADTLIGGLGNDTYVVDVNGDFVTELAGQGTDTVTAKLSWTLGANLENLTLLGTSALSGTGNELGNVLTGNAAANLLNGMAGDDTLVGGGGADSLTGGLGRDAFRFTILEINSARDTIQDFVHGTDRFEFVRSAYAALAGLSAGALAPSEFIAGKAAVTASQHIIYNQSTGALYYDVDGSGKAAQVQIAMLSNRPVLDASDFWLV
ncbi:hypothetical protein H7F51_00550 [Novosphingobium flavum]|uniref:Calcium-binding protein n=1 Tax=Novosphingobium flavum TaxID=1778672 RepID=A0A7X1FNK7_9SPHN|nr:calcium-binding protein [Novosphingobium flavum]MBC2663998.1 hypothetical protein [Novosphingobium flavum]